MRPRAIRLSTGNVRRIASRGWFILHLPSLIALFAIARHPNPLAIPSAIGDVRRRLILLPATLFRYPLLLANSRPLRGFIMGKRRRTSEKESTIRPRNWVTREQPRGMEFPSDIPIAGYSTVSEYRISESVESFWILHLAEFPPWTREFDLSEISGDPREIWRSKRDQVFFLSPRNWDAIAQELKAFAVFENGAKLRR